MPCAERSIRPAGNGYRFPEFADLLEPGAAFLMVYPPETKKRSAWIKLDRNHPIQPSVRQNGEFVRLVCFRFIGRDFFSKKHLLPVEQFLGYEKLDGGAQIWMQSEKQSPERTEEKMATEKKSVLRYPRVLVSILVVTALIICHFIVPSSNNGLKWIFDSVVLAFLVILFCIYQQEKEAEEEKKKRGKNDSDEERRDDR